MFHLSRASLFAIFFVCVTSVVAASELDPPAEIEDAMNSCCRQGREFGANNRAATCKLEDKLLQQVPAGDLPNPNFPRSNYSRVNSTCEIFFETCCQRKMDVSAKEEGLQIARRGDSCIEATKDFGEAYKNKAISSCTACYSGNNNTFSEDNCKSNQSAIIKDSYHEVLNITSICKKQGKQFGKNKRAATCMFADKNSQKVPAGDLPNAEVPASNYPRAKEVCEIVFEAWCMDWLDLWASHDGQEIARKGDSCVEATQNWGDAYKKEAMNSCTACYRGKENAKRKGDCEQKSEINYNYDRVFRECCNDK